MKNKYETLAEATATDGIDINQAQFLADWLTKHPPVSFESAFNAFMESLPANIVITRREWGDWRVASDDEASYSTGPNLMEAVQAYLQLVGHY